MTNTDFFGNNLLNIINGGCPENNPLKYFTKPNAHYTKLDILDIKTLYTVNKYNMDIWIKESYDETNLIYTFAIIDNEITIVCINKEKEIIEKTYIVSEYNSKLKDYSYYLYIVKNNLYYTYIDNENNWTWLGCIDLTKEIDSDEVVLDTESKKEKLTEPESNGDMLISPLNLDLEFFNDEKYLYIKIYYIFKNCIMRYNIDTKEVDKFLIDDELNENFTFTVDDNIIYVINSDGILEKHLINNEYKTTTLICETELDKSMYKKKMIIVSGILYISNVMINNCLHIVAYEVNTLKILWKYRTNYKIDDFKIMYGDMFFQEKFLFKKVNLKTGYLVSSFLLKDVKSFQVSSDSNIYCLLQNDLICMVPCLENN